MWEIARQTPSCFHRLNVLFICIVTTLIIENDKKRKEMKESKNKTNINISNDVGNIFKFLKIFQISKIILFHVTRKLVIFE